MLFQHGGSASAIVRANGAVELYAIADVDLCLDLEVDPVTLKVMMSLGYMMHSIILAFSNSDVLD